MIGTVSDSDGSAPGRAGTSDERNPAKTILSGLPGDDADDVLMQSSIITTLNAKTAATQRLGVKPEVKLRAILEISNALARTLKLDDVLQGLLDGLFKVFPQADTGFVVLADREEGKSLVRASQARGAGRDRFGPHLQHDRQKCDGERGSDPERRRAGGQPLQSQRQPRRPGDPLDDLRAPLEPGRAGPGRDPA